MSKLEEQLRKSRQQELPDLQPPAGGWEAVQASLAAGTGAGAAAGAAAEATIGANGAVAGAAGATVVAAAGTKASLLVTLVKVTLGLLVLGGIAAGTWLTIGSEETTDPEVGSTATIATTDDQTEPLSEKVLGGTVTNVPAADLETEGGLARDNQAAANSAAMGNQPARAFSAKRNTNQGTATTEAARPPSITPTPNSTIGPVADSATANKAVQTPTQPNNSPSSDEQSANAPANGQLPASTPTTGNSPTNDTQSLAEKQQTMPAVGFTEVSDPTPSQSNQSVTPIPAKPIDRVTDNSQIIFTGFESLTPFGLAADEGKFRKYKRPVSPSWQIHGGVSRFWDDQAFSRGGRIRYRRVDSGMGEFDLTLPNGEVVGAEFASFIGTELTKVSNTMYRLGITRQTAWGGAFRGTLGHFRGAELWSDNFGQLAPDELGTRFEVFTRATTLEIGLQYTFLKRHKFRPYLGINGMFFLDHRQTEKAFIFDAQSGQEVLRNRTEDNAGLVLTRDLSYTFGFQYQVTSRLSAGAYMWGNEGYDFLLESPFGLEVRYLLK